MLLFVVLLQHLLRPRGVRAQRAGVQLVTLLLRQLLAVVPQHQPGWKVLDLILELIPII